MSRIGFVFGLFVMVQGAVGHPGQVVSYCLVAGLGAAKKTRVERKCEGRDPAIVTQLYERALDQTNEGWEKMRMIKDARRWCSENDAPVKDYNHCLAAIVNEHVWRREAEQETERVREIDDLNTLEQAYATQALQRKRKAIANAELALQHWRKNLSDGYVPKPYLASGFMVMPPGVKELEHRLEEVRGTIPKVKLSPFALGKVGFVNAKIFRVDSKTAVLIATKTHVGREGESESLYVSGVPIGHLVTGKSFPRGVPLVITGTRDDYGSQVFLAEPADIDLHKIERWIEYHGLTSPKSNR